MRKLVYKSGSILLCAIASLAAINCAQGAVIGSISTGVSVSSGDTYNYQFSMGVCTTEINPNEPFGGLLCDGSQIGDPQPSNIFVTDISYAMGPAFMFTEDASTNPEFTSVSNTLTDGSMNAINFTKSVLDKDGNPTGGAATGIASEADIFYGDPTGASGIDLAGNVLTHYDVIFSNIDGSSNSYTYDVDIVFYGNPVPIPPAVMLFGSGLIGLIGISRRKKA